MAKDFTKSPIIVVGAARSGTSMVCGTIHLCGAWKGDTVGPSRYNEKGMFENHELREKVTKPLIFSAGGDRKGQFPLPKTKDVIIPHDLRDSVLKIIKKQGWTKDKPWVYKGAKVCLVHPAWRYAFPDSRWVIVRRKTPDIINSCLRTGFMNAYALKKVQKQAGVSSEEEGWLQWIRKHEEKFVEIIQSGVNAKVVWPERMVESNYQQMMETIEWLGLEWNGKAVYDFIEPRLFHSRKNKK